MISKMLYERAVKVIPAGVTRPFRFFDPYPFYAKKAYESKLVDFEDRVYLDFWMNHGAGILGHMHPLVVKATREQLELGFFFGVCNEWEVKLAEQIVKLVPSVDMVRFCNSGTEANMYALKLARAYTKRDKIGKFEFNFHGVYEPLYVAMSFPLDEPDSAGHVEGCRKYTVILPYNDLDEVSKIIKKEQLACVILEPVVGGLSVPADKEFLKGLREVCDDTGTLLIFDEVITGFRLAPGGAQEVFRVNPDITTFAKTVSGGEFPIGAFGGKAEIMDLMDHLKHPKKSEHVVQGGTFAGIPLVMRVGYEVTKEYEKGNLYTHINKLGEKLKKGLEDAVEDTKVNAFVTGFGSLVKLHLLKEKPHGKDLSKDLRPLVKYRDKEREKKYFHHLIANGIFAMTPGEVHFYLSLPHTEKEIEKTVITTEDFLKSLN